jgi:DNA polymerase III epsilon subunit family exonuclease
MEDPVIALLCIAGGLVVLIFIITTVRQRSGQEDEAPSFLPDVSPARTDAIFESKTKDLSTLLPRYFVVLDFETTGLRPERDEIIEFGAIRVTLDAETQATFQTLVKPVRKIPAKITEITGITQEMVDRDGLPLEDALRQFMEFIGDLPLVTFNAEFDIGFLHNAARKNDVQIANRYTCALKRARRAWPGLASYRLADLAKLGNLSDVDTHRALGDCNRALIVFTAATSTLGKKVRWTTPLA